MQEGNTDPKKNKDKVKVHPTIALLNSINYDSDIEVTPMERTVESGAGDLYGYNIGLGASRFDENLSPASQINFDDFANSLEDYRSKKQSGFLKTGALLGRVGTKVAAELSKMPGVIGGSVLGGLGQIGDLITGEDNTDFVETAFNNKWINAIQDIEESIKEDVLPVYVKKAVKEGNLWDNITSIDFWATEGADGAGYIISMLAPGAIINKYGLGSKILGVNKYAEMAAKTKNADEALNLLNKAQLTSKNADLATATFANTLFESAAEAKGSMDSLKQELEFRKNLPLGHEEYLSEEQYQEELQKISQVGRNVFGANFGILLLPNAIVSKMLWGKPRNRTPNGLFKDNRLQALQDPKLSVKAGRIGKDFLYAGGREGLWEEGLQSTVEQYFTENPDTNLFSSDFIGDLSKAYADMFSSTDGQKAMFLGAFFGGGIQSVTGAKNRKNERINTNKLIEAGNTMLTDFYNVFNEDLYIKDDEGNIVFEEEMIDNKIIKKPKVDSVKLMEKIKSVNELEKLSAIYDIAVETNNKEQIKQIKDILVTNLVKPFIVNDNIGIEVLEQHLKDSSELADINEREGTSNDTFINDVINRAKKLKADYTLFDNFSQDVLTLDNAEATNSEKVDFYNKLASQYLDTKSRKYFLESELQETENIYKELLNEKGRNLSDIETNFRLRDDLKTQDLRINKIDNKFNELKSQLEKVDSILNAFWDGKSANNKFNSEIKNKRKIEAELKEVEKLTNEVLDKFKSAKTIDELNEIEIPDNVAKNGLEISKQDRLKELQEELKTKSTEAEQQNEEFNESNSNRKLEEQDKIDFITDNYNVGEEITIPEVDRIPKEFHNQTAKIESLENGVIELTTESGKKLNIKPDAFLDIFDNSIENNFRSEGGLDTVQEVEEDSTSRLYEDRNQPRIVITDNNKGNKLDFVDQAALDFERSPRNKVGEEKGIEINKKSTKRGLVRNDVGTQGKFEHYNGEKVEITLKAVDSKGESAHNTPTVGYRVNISVKQGDGFLMRDSLTKEFKTYDEAVSYANKFIEKDNKNNLSNNQQKAVEMIDNNDFSDIEFLINHLPLNIKLTDSVVAPLETKSEKSKAYNDIFNKTSKDIRTTIVKELAKGTKIEDITIDIGGQNNGQIQLTSPIEENNIASLYEFSGDISKIKTEDIYFVDDFGTLINSREDVFSTKRLLAPGEIYIKIHTAAGNTFPLKLNVAKITEDKAELLYELYKYRFEGVNEEGELKRLSTFNTEFFDSIKESFSDILDLFNKSLEDVTVKDLVDFIIWEGTTSKKSQVKFTKSGKLLLLDKSFTKEEFNSIGVKEKFIDTIVNNKRHQIKFKRKETDSNNLNITDSRKYLEYLINNNILNTNAKVGEPTFQGKTTMYLDKTSVKVNGSLSEYNSDVKKTYSTKIIGNNSSLKKNLPGLFDNSFTLNESEDAYIDKDGLEYKRATSLKDKPFNSKNLRLYNASKRGDVVDELVRLFFSKDLISLDEFNKRAEKELKSINESKPNTTLEISKNYFESLYNILDLYKDEFDRLGYTIYSNAPTIGGTIGNKGKIAGTVDLLAFDNINKSWVLIDLKTSTQDRGTEYNKELDPNYVKKKGYSYKEQDKIQLNTYKELFYQTTGKIISDLKVMPLTSKSEDTDNNNTTFYNLFSSKEGLLLNVNLESIYDILNINKNSKEQDSETESEKITRETQGSKLLSKFGINVTNVPEVTKKEEPTISEQKSGLTYEEMRVEAAVDYKDDNYSIFKYNGTDYVLTFNFYAINASKGEIITDSKQTERLYTEYNKVAANENAKFNIDNLKSVWQSRIGDKEEIKKDSKVLDFSNLSEAKAKEIFTKLLQNFKVYIKDIQNISKREKNIKDKVNAIIKYLKSKDISEEQIKNKCNL